MCVGQPRVRVSCFRLSSFVRLYRLACTTGAYRGTCPPPAQRHRTPPFSKLRRVARNVQSEVGRKTANLGRLHLTQNAVFRSIGQHTLPMWVSGHLCCLSGSPKELARERARHQYPQAPTWHRQRSLYFCVFCWQRSWTPPPAMRGAGGQTLARTSRDGGERTFRRWLGRRSHHHRQTRAWTLKSRQRGCKSRWMEGSGRTRRRRHRRGIKEEARESGGWYIFVEVRRRGSARDSNRSPDLSESGHPSAHTPGITL